MSLVFLLLEGMIIDKAFDAWLLASLETEIKTLF